MFRLMQEPVTNEVLVLFSVVNNERMMVSLPGVNFNIFTVAILKHLRF